MKITKPKTQRELLLCFEKKRQEKQIVPEAAREKTCIYRKLSASCMSLNSWKYEKIFFRVKLFEPISVSRRHTVGEVLKTQLGMVLIVQKWTR